MPLKCQDPDTGVHTCTTAHAHRHTRAHRHAHVRRLLRAVTETGRARTQLQICRPTRPPGHGAGPRAHSEALCVCAGTFSGEAH